MGFTSPWHWAIVAVVVIILFGSKKLPEAARGLGRSLRIFKSEVKEMQNDGKSDADTAPAQQPVAPAQQPVAPAQLPSPAPVAQPNTETQHDAKSA
ncbi:Sec-independent protein translocase subunit TatA [Rhodococcus sp. IEGM 1401]|uniref:Sec-independent protein translocase subunit TatA n=1 Tax=unclassified Rhodococcus (in: high G+C Gram-positive bacteria) TaxID=192944 RepID=UPI0022B38441|nr:MULTISPECIES: Sec-independent protein translocase subunit TatA [unclassified Rhodococcus (in: high G+C Gram-positive bacteria)]MCZ4560281.1 Sec-independent protein translocase subunit TatA [Rhodococcus sp. IEGM 1401]MDI9920408.1 Sec-independent protein translocase subunit TatA [Rhodococcus sp. IEGM 1372]MDV8032906.1 Sec-independent protein translocase subunit TatA [Rhodococcus sp. IEGM 1414]